MPAGARRHAAAPAWLRAAPHAVLAAFQVVEDQLSSLHALAEEEGARRAASEAADRTEQLTQNQYLQGQIPYTTVVAAQVTALNARQALSQLVATRQAAAVALIEAIGGGWQAPEPAGAVALTPSRQARD